MSKYFAKYLLAEGEKVGELFQKRRVHIPSEYTPDISEFEWFVKWDDPVRGVYNCTLPVHPENDCLHGITYKVGAKVSFRQVYYCDTHESFDCARIVEPKLLLCSRDIQVGDIASASYPSTVTKNAMVIESMDDMSVPHWRVKYNDDPEFYYWEKDVTFKVIGAISPEAAWIKEGDEFDETEVHRCFVHENVSTLSHPMKRKVQIKGPCGHFH